MSSLMIKSNLSRSATRQHSTDRASRRPAAIVVLLMAFVGFGLTACMPPAEGTNLTDLNEVRAAVGLPELSRTPELDAKAKAQADRMANRATIFHSSNLASGVTEGWSSIGENVALAGSVDDAQRALEASPGHYANMVNPAFNQVGIGVTVRSGVTYVVQIFVSR
jgi:uncharacterized protein YkwD